ncbi:radial spoke head 14 homolog [Centruroides vittatus]|uniref:radial spoke head 14 homolog n=1 Tax=Centruroides vittatus TaxID=120091 RepID=UPI0035108721
MHKCFLNSGNVPISSVGYPVIHPTKENFAYEGWNYYKVNALCQDNDEETRKKTLQSLCDLLYDPQNAYQYLRRGLRENLESTWIDSDEFVCTKGAEILSIITVTPAGRKAFLAFNLIEGAILLLDHELQNVRKHAYTTLRNLSCNPEGSAAIVYHDSIIILIKKLKEENDENKEIILEIIHECLKINAFKTEKVLNAGAITIIIELFESDSIVIKRKAAIVMADLCMSEIGKTIACEQALDAIIKHLKETTDSEFRTKLCYLLVMITVIIKGKFKAVEGNALPLLLCILEDSSVETRKNCLKAITMLAEVPTGREFFLKNIQEIRHLLSDPDKEVREIAEVAYEVIIWKPS